MVPSGLGVAVYSGMNVSWGYMEVGVRVNEGKRRKEEEGVRIWSSPLFILMVSR